MSVEAVAFVPAAPLLVPAIAGGSVGLDAELRAAAVAAVARVVSGDPDEVVIVAAVDVAGAWSSDAIWDFAGFGVPRHDRDSQPRLPWSLGIGAWLLDECGWDGPRRYAGVTESDDAVSATDHANHADHTNHLGRRVVLAVGDGSGCRTERAPGYLDARAEPFDAVVAAALSSGDIAALAAVDSALAGELLCRSGPVWRRVGAMMTGSVISEATLTSHVAPYGVGYFVASWSVSPAS